MKIDEVIKRIKNKGSKITPTDSYLLFLQLADHIKNLEKKNVELEKLVNQAVKYP